MFNRRICTFQNDSVPFTCARSKFLCVAIVTSWVEWDCDVIADVDNGRGGRIVPIGSDIYALDVHFDLGLVKGRD